MFHLKNAQLEVEILDPTLDLARLGSRYCVGGYIYQVSDQALGPLLAGPQFPAANPDVFHGQGAPEQFVRVLNEDAELGEEVAVIGVGRVRRTGKLKPSFAHHNPEVLRFLPWLVESTPTSLTLTCEDVFRDHAYRLKRMISLNERSLSSETQIENTGTRPLPIEWFAHPFFPLNEGGICCKPSLAVKVPENAGYALNEAEFIEQKTQSDWARGYYLALEFEPATEPLRMLQRHPKLGQVLAETNFPPQRLPIWGNDRTFSFEPYFIRELSAGSSAEFGIRYDF